MNDTPQVPDGSWRDRVLNWIEQRLQLSELFSFLSHFGLVTVPLDTKRPDTHDAIATGLVLLRWAQVDRDRGAPTQGP